MVKRLTGCVLTILCSISFSLQVNAASIYLSSNWTERVDGVRILDEDVIVTDTSTGQTSLFFDGSNYLSGINLDINNFDLLSDGSFVFSPGFDMTVSGTSYLRGDIIRYDPSNGSSSLYLRGSSVISGTSIIDALAMRSDGSFIFSAAYDNGSIGGVAFDRSDIVDYNPFTGVASIYLTRDQIFDANNPGNNLVNIQALDFLPNGNILLATANNGYFIGGVEYDPDDVVEFNPNTFSASLFLDGETIYGTNTSLDAVSIDAVPIPGAVWLLGSGLVGLVSVRRIKR